MGTWLPSVADQSAAAYWEAISRCSPTLVPGLPPTGTVAVRSFRPSPEPLAFTMRISAPPRAAGQTSRHASPSARTRRAVIAPRRAAGPAPPLRPRCPRTRPGGCRRARGARAPPRLALASPRRRTRRGRPAWTGRSGRRGDAPAPGRWHLAEGPDSGAPVPGPQPRMAEVPRARRAQHARGRKHREAASQHHRGPPSAARRGIDAEQRVTAR